MLNYMTVIIVVPVKGRLLHYGGKSMSKYAVIVVDMLNDFVTGALACERGKAIVPAVAELCNAARESGFQMTVILKAWIKNWNFGEIMP